MPYEQQLTDMLAAKTQRRLLGKPSAEMGYVVLGGGWLCLEKMLCFLFLPFFFFSKELHE